MVAASVVDDMRRELGELRLKVASLEGALGQAIMEREWWQDQYRSAQAALDKLRAGP
jgi:hypothetical protein